MNPTSVWEQLEGRILTLSETIWEGRCRAPDIQEWLGNFDGRHQHDRSVERLHALYLLSRVSFFGEVELRVLLRSLFRDHFQYRLVQQIRKEFGGTRDSRQVDKIFRRQLVGTRFLGMGSPAESGTHLLYYFRQENHLPKELFPHQHELFTSAISDPKSKLRSGIERIVFIDDLCGSGKQAVTYSKGLLRDIRMLSARANRTVEAQYLVLFGTERGLENAAQHSDFDVVEAVSELDETYETYGPDSRVFRRAPEEIDKSVSEDMANGYGAELWPAWPLGYENGQLLLGFHHNMPNNSLPILWCNRDNPPWTAILPRHHKR